MNKLCIIALLFTIGAVFASKPMDDAAWREFKLHFGKFYKTEGEEETRYGIWRQRVQEVQQHNADKKNKFQKGLNHFSDLVCMILNILVE